MNYGPSRVRIYQPTWCRTIMFFLNNLPMTTHGKIDRAALPDPDYQADLQYANALKPRIPMKKVVAIIWSKVLDREQNLQDGQLLFAERRFRYTRCKCCPAWVNYYP